MASIDGSRSLQVSSEETFQFECNPCVYDGAKKEALYFCAECGDYLCQFCELLHRKFSSTRKHSVMSVNLRPRKEDSSVHKDDIGRPMCSCFQNEVTHYCGKHKEATCEPCCVIKHRKCKTGPISGASAEFEVSAADNTLANIHELKDTLLKLKTKRTKHASDLKEMAEACRHEIRSFKAELVSELSKREKNTLDELDKHNRTQNVSITKHIDTCYSAIKQIDSESQCLEAAKRLNEKHLMFVYNLNLVKLKEHLDELVDEVNKEGHEPIVSFIQNVTLKQPNIRILGTIGVQGSQKTLGDMSITSKCKVCVKHPSDKKTIPYISGSVFMHSGELVLSDSVNFEIKILAANFTFKESIGLASSPTDIAIVNDTKVVTALPNENKLQIIRVQPKVQLGRTLQLEKACLGVDVNDGRIYVSFHDREIRVLDFNGQTLTTISQTNNGTFLNTALRYISVTAFGKIVVIEDKTPSVVRCLLLDGTAVFRLKDPELRRAKGVYVDADETIFVCGRDSHNVKMIDKNGHNAKTFLTKTDGLRLPICIAFRRSDNCLVVGGNTQNLLVCKME